MEYLDNIEEEYVHVGDNDSPTATKPKEDDESSEAIFQEPEPEPIYKPCDMRSTLYVLQPDALVKINDYVEVSLTRPFLIKKIPYTNLVLVVVNLLMPSRKIKKQTSTKPEPIDFTEYGVEFPCYKLNMSYYERRRIEECYTEHENETTFTYCGKAIRFGMTLQRLLLIMLIMFYATCCFIQF